MATPPVPTANISDGQLVQNTDLDGYGDATNGFPGTLGNMIAGVSSVNSNVSPLTIVPGTGFNIVIGGTGQWFMLQGQIVDYLPGLTETLAGSSSLDRYDLVCAQYAKVNGEPYTTSFLSITGALTTGQTVYETLRGAAWQVVQGTPGAGQTAATPNGWVAVAWVKVPGSSSGLVQSNISFIIPTWAQVIAGYAPASTNTSLNGQSGALTLTSPLGTIAVTQLGSNIRIDVASPGITVIESTDGTIGVTPVSGGFNLSAQPSGVSIVASSIYCRLRRSPSGPPQGSILAVSGTTTLSPVGTPLGSFLIAGGASQCLQMEYKVKVKPGAGAQTVSGACDQIGGYCGAFLDESLVNGLSSPNANFAWSITVPDDGNYHNIELQNVNGSTINCYWSSWAPQLNGSVDYTKFAYIGPTNANYSRP